MSYMYPTNFSGCITPCKEIAYLRQTQNKHETMKNVYHKKKWNVGLLQLHVDLPHTPLTTSKHNDKSEKDYVKIKLRRDPTSENSYPYEFKMALFYNGYREDVFVRS